MARKGAAWERKLERKQHVGFKIAERNEKEGPKRVWWKGESGRILLSEDKLNWLL